MTASELFIVDNSENKNIHFFSVPERKEIENNFTPPPACEWHFQLS